MKSIKAGFCPLPVSWNSPSTVPIVDIMKQKRTLGGAATFTPASAPANCSASSSPASSPAGWKECRKPECGRQIVEAGAHDGKLAADILNWLQSNRSKLFEQIEYGIVEPSARWQEWQRETLKDFAPRVRWFSDLQAMVGRDSVEPTIHGIIFSNELLDAFPVHRFGWDAKKQKLVRVGRGRRGRKIDLGENSTFSLQPSAFRLGSRSARRLHHRNLARRRKLVARSRRRSGARQAAGH